MLMGLGNVMQAIATSAMFNKQEQLHARFASISAPNVVLMILEIVCNVELHVWWVLKDYVIAAL